MKTREVIYCRGIFRVPFFSFFAKGPLIIYTAGWGRGEIGQVNDFSGNRKVRYMMFASQRLGSTF